jgi:O-acetyl-ADP-ribose deacetylase (regulator of RNase III)
LESDALFIIGGISSFASSIILIGTTIMTDPRAVDVHSKQHSAEERTDHGDDLKRRNLYDLEHLDLTVLYPADPALARLISVVPGNIADFDVDAIVNAANESLLGGGGVDEAIHRRAGPGLLAECRSLPENPRTGFRCDVGEAVLTRGHSLPARHVIHTVAPLLDEFGREQPALLQRCYESCLRYVDGSRIRSIAFCSLGTGFYGYPQEGAARVALRTVHDWLLQSDNRHRVQAVVFATFGEQQTQVYRQLVACYFPTQ